MKNRTIGVLILALLLAAPGCGNSDDGPNTPAGGSAGSETSGVPGTSGSSGTDTGGIDNACQGVITDRDAEGNPLVIVNDSQNYSFSASLIIQTVRVNSASNLLFDWSAVTRDLRLRELDPLLGVDMLEVVLFTGVTQEEITQLMSIEGNLLDYVYGLIVFQTGNAATSAHLFDMQPPAFEFTQEEILGYLDTTAFPPESSVYSVLLAEGAAYGKGNLMITFIRSDPNETNTEVRFTNESTVLDYTVDMTSMKRIGLPPGVANITVDWTDDTILTKNAIGNDFIPTRITYIMVGHYANKTPSEVQDQFLDIDRVADEMWTKEMLVGTKTSLSELATEAGEPFPGIDDNGTWLIALICGDCTSPAPWFLSILEPCPN